MTLQLCFKYDIIVFNMYNNTGQNFNFLVFHLIELKVGTGVNFGALYN